MSARVTNEDFRRFAGTASYIASEPLIDAVNCALALERPLLIKGEPGTGKTLLARHVATALGMPMESWHIKSSTKAVEGLYVYDTVQRLNDSRFGGGDVADIRRYIRFGPLGRVFAAERRHVLLIDEVDKADVEFPNDLLRELDEMRFTVVETGDEVVARERPMVIITSNNEKELPDAFLRRCIFHFIEFPDTALMKKIVDVHYPNLDAALLDQVLIKFYWLREQNELRKKPSTSELIDWIAALLRSGMTAAQVEEHIPFLGALLKNETDTEALQRYDERQGRYPTRWSDLGPRYNQ
jgi:MoxR-like ATPase